MDQEKKIKILFNTVLFLIGFALAFLLIYARGQHIGYGINVSRIDTVVTLGKAIVNNYSFTQPTVYKETTIIYDSTKKVLSRQDSDYIVQDYLKRREYTDSVKTDTSAIYYYAIIEKNSLAKIDLRQWYRPKVYSITKTKEFNYLLFGGGFGYYLKPTVCFNLSYQRDKFDYGLTYDPLLKGGYFTIKRKIKL